MKDPEGFSKAMDEIFEKFSEGLATLRVYFREQEVVVTSDTHVMGGRLFEPKQLVCQYEKLPDFLIEKISILKAAGRGVAIQDIGEWKTHNHMMFYVKATPKQWNEYCLERGYG